ncbi:MAG: RecQ family ATP-dependent DNA helicase [Lachnospiraceae bacterium]|nr:RecQ family ATP-dependent DNA helicase [Lachnospiraceae bacterium]
MIESQQILKKYFGYDGFRPGQEKLITAVLNGRDVQGIMPTGAGKSLCFQIPALMLDGITIVISPLISLMKDQVAALNAAGIHAAYLNSSLTPGQFRKALEYAKNGRYKIIYVAPERLDTDRFLDFALSPGVDIPFLAVDEAHCVSQWGQDFRPSYLKIMDFVDRLPHRPVIGAYTATATRQVRNDVLKILRLQNPVSVTTGFDRDNLYYAVKKPADKYSALRYYIREKEDAMPGLSGIVYCGTRKNVDEVTRRLQEDGYSAAAYHAGLSEEERNANQEAFINGDIQIMVATNAFGMGIDKSDVRFVVHYNMPKDMESYYQEAGRAGRDGEMAECLLLYSGQDVKLNEFLIEKDKENDELTEEQKAIIKERDRERLKKMTFYCFSKYCLRSYILEYFGEPRVKNCGNCSVCLGLGTGEKPSSAKSKGYGYRSGGSGRPKGARESGAYGDYGDYADTADFYAGYDDYSQANGYIEDYGRAGAGTSPAAGKKGGSGKKPSMADLNEKERKIFESLRSLRTEIARENQTHPYIIFSDKTLIEMCRVMPRNREELLGVSGVGEYKLNQYGKRFLDTINALRQ